MPRPLRPLQRRPHESVIESRCTSSSQSPVLARTGASDPAATRRFAEPPAVLGQACHWPVDPLDSHPQGFALPAQPLDLPLQGLDLLPQGFNLPGVPPLFPLVLRGQPLQGQRQLAATTRGSPGRTRRAERSCTGTAAAASSLARSSSKRHDHAHRNERRDPPVSRFRGSGRSVAIRAR